MKTIQLIEAVKFGWKATMANFWFFLGITLLLFITSRLIPDFFNVLIDRAHYQPAASLLGVVSIISILVSAFIRLGFAKMGLDVVDQKPLSYQNFFAVQKSYWPYIGAALLVLLGVSLGMILFVVPGIMLGLAWLFTAYIILDKGMNPIDSLKESARITQGYRWQLLGFVLLLCLMNIIGGLLFGIGLLWTIPVSVVAMAHVYRQLL